MIDYYVVREKNTGLYFRGKGANRWGKYYNQASIYRIKAHAVNTANWLSLRGETSEVVQIRITENAAEPTIDLQDDDFGCILNCAVRYAIGRQSYMPSLVIGFITPLLPYLNSKTLWCFDQDTTNAKWEGGYGDPYIDEPGWLKFREAVRAERLKRGDTLYVSHWESDAHKN